MKDINCVYFSVFLFRFQIVNGQLALLKRIEELHASNYRHCNINLNNMMFKPASPTELKPYWGKPKNIQEEIEFKSKVVIFPSFDGSGTTYLIDPKSVLFLEPADLEEVQDLEKPQCVYLDYQTNDILDAALHTSSSFVKKATKLGFETLISHFQSAFDLVREEMPKGAKVIAGEESGYLKMLIELLSDDKKKTEDEAMNAVLTAE